MIKKYLYALLVALAVGCFSSCGGKKIPLDETEFRLLLLEMHKVDATLTVNRDMGRYDELKNYAYYNKLFDKFGITRADFDSCMYFYSSNSEVFSEMYDFIIDSLNKELTDIDQVVAKLKENDSINYFPVQHDSLLLDTIMIDKVVKIQVDSIVPGLYKFSTTLQFDSVNRSRNRRIAARFISADNKDTLSVRQVIVSPDTLHRVYSWSQYVDTLYQRLEINFMEAIPLDERPKVYRNGKMQLDPKNKKLIDLKVFKGKAWNNQLFRPYLSKRSEQQLKRTIQR